MNSTYVIDNSSLCPAKDEFRKWLSVSKCSERQYFLQLIMMKFVELLPQALLTCNRSSNLKPIFDLSCYALLLTWPIFVKYVEGGLHIFFIVFQYIHVRQLLENVLDEAERLIHLFEISKNLF